MTLFQLSTGRLLTGDIAAAVKRDLSVPLARVVEAALLGSEPLSTAVGLKAALGGLPSVLVGDDPAVTAALGQLAGDLIHERKAKLLVLTRSSNRTEEDGPTRVFFSDDPPESEDADESTVPLKPQRLGITGRRVVRPPPTIEAPTAPLRLLFPTPPSPPAVAPAPLEKRALPSLARVERALLYVLGALVALVVVLSVVRPERWRSALEHVRGLR
jgi:hypothetical protein